MKDPLEAQTAADAPRTSAFRDPNRGPLLSSLRLGLLAARVWSVDQPGSWVVSKLCYFLFVGPHIALSRLVVWSAESAVKLLVMLVEVAAENYSARSADDTQVGGPSASRWWAHLGCTGAPSAEDSYCHGSADAEGGACETCVHCFIERQWREAKSSIKDVFRCCFQIFEYYGPISLYRIVKWILNPVKAAGPAASW